MDNMTKDLAALIERDQGLPGAYFTDPGFFERERRDIFLNSWICVALSDDAPKRGDLYPVTVLGIPLLLARDADQLHVFHNACSHRGAALADAPSTGQQRIICPYHAWTYRLDGRLLGTPHVAGAGRHVCERFERGELALRAVRSAEWAGHVFVNLSGTAPAFADWIAPVAARFSAVDWSQCRHDRTLTQRVDVAANWKIIIENFAESYHVPRVHPKLEKVNPMARHYQILGGHSYLGQGSASYQGTRIGGGVLPLFSGSSGASFYEALYIFPNLILGPLPDIVFSIIVRPESAEQSNERLSYFFSGEEALTEQHDSARRATADFITEINSEDVRIVESVQRGRHSPSFSGGQFSEDQEATSLQLQKMVAARILAGGEQDASQLVPLPVRDIHHPGEA